jgi:4-amino-4-deoxy-L-arabinose transferase-like glycosyltransferase
MAAGPLPLGRGARPVAAEASGVAAGAAAAALAAITALAAVLRFEGLGGMRLNPYYDAAVRSMGSSWHAFLVGAFNPNASVAIDKPPVDLWLQVASTKLFGFTHFALLLPEALASTLAVVLMYDLVRRGFGRVAGLAAAATLAVLPIEVVTARSDTMDSFMMALLVLAAWLVVRAVESERARELYLAGAVVGLAFETKLFEALVPLPALVVLFLVGSTLPWPRRIKQLAIAGVVMAAVALAWPAMCSVTPAGDRPYPMGSKNGNIWDTVFVYNGIGRLNSTSIRQRVDHLNPPGPTRLIGHGLFHLDALIGTALIAAIAFGLVALAFALARGRPVAKLRLGLAAGMGSWLVLAAAVLSFIWHMPLRYLEPLAPAVAAVLGIGVGVCVRAGTLAPAAVLGATAASLVYAGSTRALPPAAVLGAVGLVAVVLIALVGRRSLAAARSTGAVSAGLAALALVAVLAVPTAASTALVRARTGDGGELGAMPARTASSLSAYLTRHRGGRRYEFASLNAALAAPLIVADDQPVLVLAGWPPHPPLLSARGLAQAVHTGEVRYVLLSATGGHHPPHAHVRGTRPRDRIIEWVRTHGVDVSHRAGLHRYGILYRVRAR